MGWIYIDLYLKTNHPNFKILMNSSFSFLQNYYPELFTICEIAEELIHIDPSSTFSKTRLFSEKVSKKKKPKIYKIKNEVLGGVAEDEFKIGERWVG